MPIQYVVVLGVGGLRHIALQSLHELCGARTIAVDITESARELAKDLGAHHVISSGPNVVEQVKELTHGGAHVVLDFVGELGAEQESWQMLREGGTHYVIGYGGQVKVPTVNMVIQEMAVAGSLVGNYMELVELMELNAEGRVKFHGEQYKLDDINKAIDDFKQRKIVGRGIIVQNG